MHLCGPVLTQQNEDLQTNINKWIPEKCMACWSAEWHYFGTSNMIGAVIRDV